MDENASHFPLFHNLHHHVYTHCTLKKKINCLYFYYRKQIEDNIDKSKEYSTKSQII